jgi:hypothetical protein
MAGAKIGPLAEIGLAEDDRAGCAEARDEFGVLGRGSRKGERTGRCHHFVAGFDVVLDEDRDAMEGSARAFVFALTIEVSGDGGGVTIQFDDGVEVRALSINLSDAREIFLDQMRSGPAADRQSFLKLSY